MSEGFNNNVEQLDAWRSRKEAAPREAATLLIERIDEGLVGQERCAAIVSLMQELNDKDPQRYHYVIEVLAEVVSIEKPAAESVAKRALYPEAAALARSAV